MGKGSSSENANPYPGKIGTKDYPMGLWWDPKDEKRTYNTPFLGVMADFEAESLSVKDSFGRCPLKKGWTVVRYRFSKEKDFNDTESWIDLSARAMESEEKTIVLRGRKPDGKEFTVDVPIQGPEFYYPGEDSGDAEPIGRGPFVGMDRSKDDAPAIVTTAREGSNLDSSVTILAIKLPETEDFQSVASWSEVERLVKAHAGKEVVVKGKKADGTAFTAVVRVKG